MDRPVIVGVDGSPESRMAVDLGAREAEWRQVPLRLVHGYEPPVMYGPTVAIAYDAATPLAYARTLVAEEADRVRAGHPDLTVGSGVLIGDPGLVLVEESSAAGLVVVGSRGAGSFHSLLLGSVSARVAGHARVPVLVVRPPARDARGVVVGVDGSPGSIPAVEFAMAEAAARGTGVTAVYAHHGDPEADRVLAEATAGWPEKYPEVEVVRRAVRATSPVRVLIEESGTAELVVVGARGRRPIAGLLLGSVSDGLVRHARVPVAVVHDG